MPSSLRKVPDVGWLSWLRQTVGEQWDAHVLGGPQQWHWQEAVWGLPQADGGEKGGNSRSIFDLVDVDGGEKEGQR